MNWAVGTSHFRRERLDIGVQPFLFIPALREMPAAACSVIVAVATTNNIDKRLEETSMTLVYRHEVPLYVIALVISLVLWVALVAGTFGVALIYALFFVLAYLFAQSAFVAHIRGTGVKVSAQQYPDINQRLVECCTTIGLADTPECYVLRTNVFNALATRFLGRDLIVLFADLTDALHDDPEALNFYIGHELGHVHRRHLRHSWLTAPARLLPILGAAYSRAREYTCDRYGLACCTSPEVARRALLATATGNARLAITSHDAYAAQTRETGSFWMSFHELISAYPWLTKRVTAVDAAAAGLDSTSPRRHGFAWFLSCFVPNIGHAGGGLFTVALMIGILAAIAIPAYSDYTTRATVIGAANSALPLQRSVQDFVDKNGKLPETASEVSGGDAIASANGIVNIDLAENGRIVVNFVGGPNALRDHWIRLEPSLDGHELRWACSSPNIPVKLLPPSCR